MATIQDKLSNIANNPESNYDNQNLKTKKNTYAKAYELLRDMVAEFDENIAKFEADFYNADIDDKEKVFAKKCKDVKYPNLSSYKDDLVAFTNGFNDLTKPDDIIDLKGKVGNQDLNTYLSDIAQLFENYRIQCKNMSAICKSLFGKPKKDNVENIGPKLNNGGNPKEGFDKQGQEGSGDNFGLLKGNNNQVESRVIYQSNKANNGKGDQVAIEEVVGNADFSIKEEEPEKVHDMFDYLHYNLGIRDKEQDDNTIEKLEKLFNEKQIDEVVEQVVEEKQKSEVEQNESSEAIQSAINTFRVYKKFVDGVSQKIEEDKIELTNEAKEYFDKIAKTISSREEILFNVERLENLLNREDRDLTKTEQDEVKFLLETNKMIGEISRRPIGVWVTPGLRGGDVVNNFVKSNRKEEISTIGKKPLNLKGSTDNNVDPKGEQEIKEQPYVPNFIIPTETKLAKNNILNIPGKHTDDYEEEVNFDENETVGDVVDFYYQTKEFLYGHKKDISIGVYDETEGVLDSYRNRLLDDSVRDVVKGISDRFDKIDKDEMLNINLAVNFGGKEVYEKSINELPEKLVKQIRELKKYVKDNNIDINNSKEFLEKYKTKDISNFVNIKEVNGKNNADENKDEITVDYTFNPTVNVPEYYVDVFRKLKEDKNKQKAGDVRGFVNGGATPVIPGSGDTLRTTDEETPGGDGAGVNNIPPIDEQPEFTGKELYNNGDDQIIPFNDGADKGTGGTYVSEQPLSDKEGTFEPIEIVEDDESNEEEKLKKKPGLLRRIGRWMGKHPVLTLTIGAVALGALSLATGGVAAVTDFPTFAFGAAAGLAIAGNGIKGIVKGIFPKYRRWLKKYNVDKLEDKIDKQEAKRERLLLSAEDILVNNRVSGPSRKYAKLPTKGADKKAISRKTRRRVNAEVAGANRDLKGVSDKDMISLVKSGGELKRMARKEDKLRKKLNTAYDKLEKVDAKIGNKQALIKDHEERRKNATRKTSDIETQVIGMAVPGSSTPIVGNLIDSFYRKDRASVVGKKRNVETVDIDIAKAVEEAIDSGNKKVALDIAAEDISLNGGTLNPEIERVLQEKLGDKYSEAERYFVAKSKENYLGDKENKASQAILENIENQELDVTLLGEDFVVLDEKAKQKTRKQEKELNDKFTTKRSGGQYRKSTKNFWDDNVM